MPRRLLFVHGAGGEDEDRPLAHAFGDRLDATLDYPVIPADDMSLPTWAAAIRDRLTGLSASDLVIAHSFGASVLLHVLAAESRVWPPVVALAMPDWGPDGWDVADYAFDGPEPSATLTLHHCRDDAEVPFEHLALNATRLPSARVVTHDTGGHQFDGQVGRVIAQM